MTRWLVLAAVALAGAATPVRGDVHHRTTEPAPWIVPPAPTVTPSPVRRIAGVAALSAGALSLAVATYLGLDARSSYQGALADHCMGDRLLCDSDGVRITRDSHDQANHATLFAAAGGTLAIGGLVLYLTAQKTPRPNPFAWRVTPAIGGLAVSGRF